MKDVYIVGESLGLSMRVITQIIFKHIFAYSFFSLFFISSICNAEINYKRTLANSVWSTNCNDVSATASFFSEDSSGIIKNYFKNGVNFGHWNITKIESVGSYSLSFTFIDGNNKNGNDFIEFNEQGYRIMDRTIDGNQLFKYGKNLKTGTESSINKKCDFQSPVYMSVMNQDSNIQTQPQQVLDSNQNSAFANSYEQACYNSSNNFKKVTYSDGVKAYVTLDLFNKYKTCACDISLPTGTLELIPSLIRDQEIPAIRDLYTKNYPYGGCPSEADYLKITQLIQTKKNEDAAREAKENQKNTEALKAYAKKLKQNNVSFCRGVPKAYSNLYEFIGNKYQVNPDSVTLKRVDLTDNALMCNAVFYLPKGKISCPVTFDSKGIVNGIVDSTFERLVGLNKNATGSIVDIFLLSNMNTGCQ